MKQSLDVLMTGLIDYAGLFPPAKLEMQPAVENYARYLQGPHAKSLGRFICPASRLEELSKHAAMLMPGTFATSGYREYADDIPAWRISVVIDGPLDNALDQIDAFNEHHGSEERGLAKADTLEMRAASPSAIDEAMDLVPEDIFPCFEVPQDVVMTGDPRGFIAALAGQDAAGKVRCGGVTPDAFPSSESLANFIALCAISDVRFKATAGLHHPVRAEQNLTYEDNPPRGVMHGFLNVFVGAAFAKAKRWDAAKIREILEETDPASFTFTDEAASWRGESVDLDKLTRGRGGFAMSYGSCSFEEPIDDVKKLGLL